MLLTEADHARVSAAVTQAEAHTDGEIVTVVATRSDAYHDVGLHWAVLVMLLALALLAWRPHMAELLHAWFADGWNQPPAGAVLTVSLIVAAIAFLAARMIFAWQPLRLLLTPASTRTRRVRRQALALFRTAAEKRTRASTGVLLYLSLAERRAELIADEAIHSKVAPEVWGEAMAVLVAAVRDDRPGDGLVAAIAKIGDVLAAHFPLSEGDSNELPDRLIEL